MNVLLIAATELGGNSALHTLSVAGFLHAQGIACAVSYRPEDDNAHPASTWPFQVCNHRDAMKMGVMFPDGRGPDLIHTWTPREHVRKLTESIVERYGCPYVVHLEDNEEVILADTLQPFPLSELMRLPARMIDAAISPYLSHPKRYRWFLEGASGVTALIEKLTEFKPEGAPGVVFWPGFERKIFMGKGTRKSFGIPEDVALLVYNGNIHRSNEDEVGSLIEAAGILKRRGVPVLLVKTGANHAAHQRVKEARDAGYLLDLGFVSRADIYALLNLADVLVQPGHPSAFNDYRFPCKLPEFLATGKPVILPATNLGRHMSDWENCMLLETGTAIEIAGKVQFLLQEPRIAARIGQAGLKFAVKRLSWESNLAPVLDLYRQILDQPVQHQEIEHADRLPVELIKATVPDSGEPYLAMAVKSVAAGEGRVRQRPGADPYLYEKWLAAEVERAVTLKLPAVTIENWLDEPDWLAATDRGYAAGLGNYLRGAGLPVSNLLLEQALDPAL